MYSVTKLMWKEREERFEAKKPEGCGKLEGAYRIRKVTVVGKGRNE